MQSSEVEIHEDNSGAVYLTRGTETWSLGPVTPDMYGGAEQAARGWVAGEWEPDEHNGQVPADLTDLTHIATWTQEGIVIERDQYGEPVAGGGGTRYLGLDAR